MGSERRMKILLATVVLSFVFTFVIVFITASALESPREVALVFATPVIVAVFVIIRWAWRVMKEWLDKVF